MSLVDDNGTMVLRKSAEVTDKNTYRLRTISKSVNEAIRLDEKSTNKVTYVGTAEVGTLNSAAVWKIFKLTEVTSGIEIEYADGDSKYDNIWDDRISLIYS